MYLFSELKSISHMVHVLTSKMIHFLHQTQYYFLFEVLECSWAEMLKRVSQAECLDDVIAAHEIFLTSVQNGVLLDGNSVVSKKFIDSHIFLSITVYVYNTILKIIIRKMLCTWLNVQNVTLFYVLHYVIKLH